MFKIGQEVRITSGFFFGNSGIVEQIGSDKVKVGWEGCAVWVEPKFVKPAKMEFFKTNLSQIPRDSAMMREGWSNWRGEGVDYALDAPQFMPAGSTSKVADASFQYASFAVRPE